MTVTVPAPVFPAVEGLDELMDSVRQSLDAASGPMDDGRGLAEFEAVRQQIASDRPEAAALLTLLWQEAVSARRSCNFWREVSDVEKELAARIAENTHRQTQSV